MRKEIVIAIIVGLGVGLVLTVGMYRARLAIESAPTEVSTQIETQVEETGSPEPTGKIDSGLRLREPLEDTWVSAPTLSFSGVTTPDSPIVILQNSREVIGESDAAGNFSVPVSIDPGVNLLVMRVLISGGSPIEVTRSLVYDPPASGASASAKREENTDQENTSANGSTVSALRERVQKVLSAQTASEQEAHPFALVGTLEKLVGSTIQILTVTGESKIGDLSKSARVTRGKTFLTREEIELNSPVVAIGQRDSDETLHIESLRISDEPFALPKRQTILGEFVDATAKQLRMELSGVNTGAQVSYAISAKTAFLNRYGNPMEKKALQAGTRVVVILPDGATATASATRVIAIDNGAL